MINSQKKGKRAELAVAKLINQYSYKVSKQKFNNEGLFLNSKISSDIKKTMNLFKNINNEV